MEGMLKFSEVGGEDILSIGGRFCDKVSELSHNTSLRVNMGYSW